jgi:hypothetical protein
MCCAARKWKDVDWAAEIVGIVKDAHTGGDGGLIGMWQGFVPIVAIFTRRVALLKMDKLVHLLLVWCYLGLR